jgi:hypothetical protein
LTITESLLALASLLHSHIELCKFSLRQKFELILDGFMHIYKEDSTKKNSANECMGEKKRRNEFIHAKMGTKRLNGMQINISRMLHLFFFFFFSLSSSLLSQQQLLLLLLKILTFHSPFYHLDAGSCRDGNSLSAFCHIRKILSEPVNEKNKIKK